MERYRKKELLKAIALMEKANKTIDNAEGKCQPEIVETLIQCQEAALKIGNCLETLGAPGQAVVTLLEDYCESLYQISQSLDDKIRYKKLTKTIGKQLIQIGEKRSEERRVGKECGS